MTRNQWESTDTDQYAATVKYPATQGYTGTNENHCGLSTANDVLKFRYRLGYESVCREVSDSITWRVFCRIGLDVSVPHPTTLVKLTTRCGAAAVKGLNETLLAKAAQAKL